MPRLYSDLVEWWPLVSPVADYAEEAADLRLRLERAGLPAAPSLLELGCGGGCNAFYLKKLFAEVTLTDLSPAMLEQSRAVNPECAHLQGDMRTLRLGRTFDVVFVHDAVSYLTTEDDLTAAIHTAYVHTRPGGVALFVPDHVRETFEPDTEHAGGDLPGRSLRYMQWTHDPDPTDTTYEIDFAYLMRVGDGPTEVAHDRHTMGLFPQAIWLGLFAGTGFTAHAITDPWKRVIFLARR